MKMKVNSFSLFYSIFLLYFIPRFLEYTTFVQLNYVNNAFEVCKTISYLLIIAYSMYAYIKRDRVSLKYLIAVVICLVYFVYQAFFENEKAIFVVFLFSLPFDIRWFDTFIKKTYHVSVFLFLLTIGCCCLGIIGNMTTEFSKMGIDTYRYSLGFIYPGQMMMSMMPIVFMYFYINKVTLVRSFIWIVIDILAFIVSKTVMSFAIILLFILLCNFFKAIQGDKKHSKVSTCIIYSPYICFVITLFLLWLKANGSMIGEKIDVIVNGRLNLGNIFIDMFGIKWFGTDFVNSTEYYYQVIDSEYVYMLVASGIIYTAIALKLMEICIRYKKDENKWCIIWILLFFNAIVNNGVFNYIFNPFGIILVPAIGQFISKHKTRLCG